MWAYLRLGVFLQTPSFRVAFVTYLAAGVAALVLISMVVTEREDPSAFSWIELLIFSALAFLAEVGIALLWHRQRSWCRSIRGTVRSRLWRGVLVPCLATFSSLPAAAVLLIQVRSESLSLPEERGWSILSFGVLGATLPIATVLAQNYAYRRRAPGIVATFSTAGSRQSTERDLANHQVFRADLFIWAQKGYAILSGAKNTCLFIRFPTERFTKTDSGPPQV
jgi:hypothetical protein